MSRDSTGLTLAEVIVMLLVAALAAMLVLPTLARTHTPSRRSYCSSNLSQIGKAIIMYTQDYDKAYTPTRSSTSDPYNDLDATFAMNLIYGNRYIRDPRVFRCAGDTTYSPPSARGAVKPANCSYSYDPGHDINYELTVIVADKREKGSNSDNHGPNAGQNCLMAGGNVEFRDTVKNDMGRDENQVQVIDTDIFSLTPSLPRELDSYLRQ